MDNATATNANASIAASTNARGIRALTEEFLRQRPSRANARNMVRSFDLAIARAESRPEGRPEPEELLKGRQALIDYLR